MSVLTIEPMFNLKRLSKIEHAIQFFLQNMHFWSMLLNHSQTHITQI